MPRCHNALFITLAFLMSILLTSCGDMLGRLEQVGKAPPLEQVVPPMQQRHYQPVTWPNQAEIITPKNHNSLWQPGARTFFRDQRARRVGDILKVIVKIADKADMDNKTERTRNATDNLGAPQIFGLQNKLTSFLPGQANPANLIEMNGASATTGDGTIARKETIQTQIAAMVTQILPNGNLVVQGQQQIRVNHELREVTVAGIVRPEDISAENAITSDQMAEARIAYGGRGQLSDLQQPRYGSQILDIVSPF